MRMKKIPFLRGIVALIESSAIGSKHLAFATDRYDEDPNNPVEEEKIEKKNRKSRCGLVLPSSVFYLSSLLNLS
ncbi:DUF1385 domain-containing protein [Plantactinospora veratri]